MQCNGQKYSHYIACYWKMGTREDISDLSTATTKEQCETMWNIKILKNSTPSQLQIQFKMQGLKNLQLSCNFSQKITWRCDLPK